MVGPLYAPEKVQALVPPPEECEDIELSGEENKVGKCAQRVACTRDVVVFPTSPAPADHL